MNWRHCLPASLRDKIEVDASELKRLLAEAAAEVPRNSLVLDAGAGEGQYRDLFAHTRYIGVDLAVGDAAWNYSGLSALNTLERLSFPDGVFDVVVCTQVLEHVAEPERVLCELQRVLRPGGRLLLSAPQRWHEHQTPHDFFRYTSYGLEHLLDKAGLVVEEMTPLGGYFWFLGFQLRLFTYWAFSRNTWSRRLGRLALPLKALSVGVFEIALPLLLYYADSLDTVREATLGHFCIACKPAPDEPA